MTIKLTGDQLRAESGIAKNHVDTLQTGGVNVKNKAADTAGMWEGPTYVAFTNAVAQFKSGLDKFCAAQTTIAEGLSKLATAHDHNEDMQAAQMAAPFGV